VWRLERVKRWNTKNSCATRLITTANFGIVKRKGA
jgi:hypothetical protein